MARTNNDYRKPTRNLINEDALNALTSGRYAEYSGRTPQYRTSQEQIVATQKLPMLEGMGASFSSDENYTPSRKNFVIDTDRARRKYAEKYFNNTQPTNEAPVTSPNINPNRDKSHDKDFDDFYNWRYDKMDVRDYDAATDTETEHWRNVKKDLMKKNNWTEDQFDKKFDEYYQERRQKESDSEVKGWTEFAEKHPGWASVGQTIMNPGQWIEGGAAAVQGGLRYLLPESLEKKYLDPLSPSDANDYRLEHTRVRDAVKETVKKKINSTGGNMAYEAGVGLLDLPGGALGMALNSAADTQKQKLQSGVDAADAQKTAAKAGLISYITNKWGLGKALGAEAKTAKGALGKAIATEGGENVIEDVLKGLSDLATNKEKSEWAMMYNDFLNQGQSPSQAAWSLIKNLSAQGATSFATGALMGGTLNALDNLPRLKAEIKADRPTVWTPEAKTEVPKVQSSLDNPMPKIPYVTDTDVRVPDANKLKTDWEAGRVPQNLQTPVEKAPEIPAENLQAAVEKPTKNYKLESVNLANGKKGYFVAEFLDENTTRNVEPGKVYKTKKEAQKVMDGLMNPESTSAPVNNEVPEDIIEDVLPEVNTRNYTDAEMAEIADYVAKRDAIRAEAEKNVNMFDLEAMTKLNDIRAQGKAMDAEMSEKYPELFNTNGKFTGIPEQNGAVDNSTQKAYNDVITKGEIPNGSETSNTNVRTGSESIPGRIDAERPVDGELRGNELEGRGYLPPDSVRRAEQLRQNGGAFTNEELASLKNSGIETPNFYNSNNDPELFVEALETAKASNDNGAAVDSHSVEQMQDIVNNGGNMYLVDNGMSGYAVEGDGNLTAVFKNSNSDTPAMGSKIALASIKNGATKGDCFGRKLVNIYARGGYEPVGRMAYGRGFNDAMDAQVDAQLKAGLISKEPDVYVLKKRDDFDYDETVKNWNNAKTYTQAELDALPEFTDYDEMLAFRDALIEQASNRAMNESRRANPRITSRPVNPQSKMPHMDGMMPQDKTSKYYKNTMRNTPTNAEMSDAEYGSKFNEDEYGYISSSHADTDRRSNQFIQDSGGEDAAINKLLNEEFDGDEKFDSVHIDAAEKLADKVERQAKELEAQGQDATEQWMLANKLHKKIRENGTLYAQGLEILKKWKQSTPQGQVDYIVTEINKVVDNKKTKGYTKMVNKVADDVENAIMSGKDKSSVEKGVKKAFEKNRANSDYNTEKYEQLVLDLIGGEDFGMRSPASIAEEAGALIKRNMGVSTLTAKQERAMIDLFEQASRYKENSRAYNECISRAMDILESTMPSSVGDKVKSIMYDNMLLSLKTMLTRNLGGNVLANAIETTSKPLQVAADVIASKVTGNRTRTLTGKSIVEGAKGFGKGVKDWGLDVKQGINTTRSGQESLEDALKAVHKTFKTQSENKVVKGINNVLGGYDRIVRKGMELGDRPIYEMRYAATKAELLDVVDKFGDEGLRKGFPKAKGVSTDELIELIAVNDGLEAVLQNDSTMKKGAQALKDAISKTSEDIVGVDLATMSTVPFVEVPANMASRFFQYTPIGIAGNIVRSAREKAKYGAVNQRRMTGEAGRNALGSLMAAGAMGLASGNYISDPYSEDADEKKLQQNNDYIEYALQTPDGEKQVDLSDVPVLGPMLRYGKMQYDAAKEGGIPALVNNIIPAAGSASIDTLYQGLNKLTGATSKYSSGDSMLANAQNAIASSVGSMINPAIVRQTAQFLDEYKRDLGDYGTSEYNKNLVINGVPVLREMMLNPKIGTSGKPVEQNGGEMSAGKFFNTYLAPWKVSHPKENMSEAQRYADNLKLSTEGKVNPQSQVFNAKDLKGIKGYDADNYTHDDLYKIDQELYNSNDALATALINDKWFRSLSPEKQGRYLDSLYSNNKSVVKENFVREGMTPEEIEKAGDNLYTANDKLAKILKEDGADHKGMMEYFHNVDGIENLEQKYGYKMDYDTYVKWQTEPDKKAMGGAEAYVKAKPEADKLDMSVQNYLKYEREYPGGAKGKYNDKQEAIDYGYVDKNGNAKTDTYVKYRELYGNDDAAIRKADYFSDNGITKAVDKIPELINDNTLSNEAKGKLLVGDAKSLKGTKKTMYDMGGYEGAYYYYLIKNAADADGNGSVKKAERNAYFAGDSKYLDDLWNLNQEMYMYLMNNLK